MGIRRRNTRKISELRSAGLGDCICKEKEGKSWHLEKSLGDLLGDWGHMRGGTWREGGSGMTSQNLDEFHSSVGHARGDCPNGS